MTQKQQTIQRDFYTEKPVTGMHILRFTAVSLVSQFAAYYLVTCLNRFFAVSLGGSASGLLLQVLLTIPAAFFVPGWLVWRHLGVRIPGNEKISGMWSLADDPRLWYRKALRLMLPGEILRFLLGLLPVPVFRYGVLTSPGTYLLYTLLYINPTESYDRVMIQGQPDMADTGIFLGIYFVYFLVYELLLLKKFRKEALRHQKYLEGCLAERELGRKYGK